jgi:multiple sugar transport system substrate-binding protein
MKGTQLFGGSRPFSTILIILFLAILGSTSCQADLLEPPRVATQTAQVISTPTHTPTPILSEAPTPTPDSSPNERASAGEDNSHNPSITIWINETSDAHEQVVEEITAGFAEESGIQVEALLVTPRLLPDLVQTAVLSDTLPDLILHPIEFSLGWEEDGILDSEGASEALELLGRDTFDPAALDILSTGTDEERVVALPSNGWQQIIVYRSDWFEEQGLEPPDTYERLSLAAETIFQPEGIISGLVVPTDATLRTTQQVFEHLATANGCSLADEQGRVELLHPACLEALEYYRMLVNEFSPIGYQTDTSALNAYLSGRTGLIISSPSVLPALAGLEAESVPNCPDCSSPDYLAQNSGFINRIEGIGGFSENANFGEIMALGITSSADRQLAIEFVEYWFNEGYLQWLSVDPERKVPIRRGNADDPAIYIDSWGELPLRSGSPGLKEIYGTELVEQLQEGIAPSSRWGFQEGQGALVTQIYEELLVAPLLQEMLSGYFTSSQTIVEMYKVVVDAIPDYQFPIEIAPTATPE